MMSEHDINSQKKISSEFETRLARLDPHQKVRVIVLLQLNTAEKTRGTRQTRLERQATIQLVQDSAAKALEHIAGTIQRFDGHSLIDRPDLLGTIPIEINAAGIPSLAESHAVKAIIEDQSIYPADSLQNS
jgi:hypothetical protein